MSGCGRDIRLRLNRDVGSGWSASGCLAMVMGVVGSDRDVSESGRMLLKHAMWWGECLVQAIKVFSRFRWLKETSTNSVLLGRRGPGGESGACGCGRVRWEKQARVC